MQSFEAALGKEVPDHLAEAMSEFEKHIGPRLQAHKKNKSGPKKGCTTGFALFQQDEYKQLTAASDSDISAADVQRKIAAKWKNNLSWQERMLWDDKAATLNKQVLEGARDARGGSSAASGNEWLIRPVPLLHSDKYILTEDQYQKVRGDSNWVDFEDTWCSSLNTPIGVPKSHSEFEKPQADLDPPDYFSCFKKGDCQQYGKRVLSVGDACNNMIAKWIKCTSRKLLLCRIYVVKKSHVLQERTFLVAHMLLNPLRSIVLGMDSLREEDSPGECFRLRFSDSTGLYFATNYNFLFNTMH